MRFIHKITQVLKGINEHPLAGKHKFLAYGKLVKWQFSQRLFPCIRKLEFLNGIHFLAARGMTGITGNIYCGLHEFNDMAFVLHFLREEDLFIDVGANVGSYTLLAAGVVGANTISFEPAPATFEKLKANIISNDLQAKTNLVNAAVGSKKGSLHFTTDLDTVNHVLLDDSLITTSTISVPVNTLDEYWKQGSNQKCLVKIDAEGFESEVLAGMSNTLADESLKVIIIELNGSGKRYGYDEKAIKKQISAAGFSAFTYDPFSRSLSLIEREGHFNTIYLRDLPFIQERIATAKKICLFGECF